MAQENKAPFWGQHPPRFRKGCGARIFKAELARYVLERPVSEGKVRSIPGDPS